MAKATLTRVMQHVRMLATAQSDANASDAELLHAFITDRDQDGFTALVHRHGPMVWHVCRRALGQQQDAEDAFQATFLILARKAAAVRKRAALASWLYGTARRIALSIKRAAARRRSREGQVKAMRPSDPCAELAWREGQALLEEEIGGLPAEDQAGFVLRCLESRSQTEVAALLGLKEGTVSSRLNWARKRLQSRLARRGVTLSVVMAAVALMPAAGQAVPAGLARATVCAAGALASGEKTAA